MSVPPPYAFGIGKSPEELAARENRKAAAEYNAQLLDMYHQTRGSKGSAILPEYLSAAESAAGRRAGDISNAVMDYYGSPSNVAARGAAIANTYKPLLAAGTKSIYGIYSGDEEAKRLAAAAPAMAARTALAGTTRAGINQSLLQRLNDLNAQDATKGFVGTGSGAQQRLLGARIAGNTAASQVEAGANLQNAQEQEAIRNQILDLQLRSPELATSLAGSASQLELLPGQIAGGINAAALSPLDYFRIGVGQPSRPGQAPWATPQLGKLDEIFGSLGQSGSAVARYFANRDIANRYGGGGGSSYSNTGYYSPASEQYAGGGSDLNTGQFPGESAGAGYAGDYYGD